MRYYISKPNSHKTDERIIKGIKKIEPDAAFVDSLATADVAVFQKGWTKSRICIEEYHLARDTGIKRVEGYIYTDKCSIKLN